MAILNIYLLGGFHLVYDSRPVDTVTNSRMQSLLAYLILHRETAQPRQRLACLFWPDSNEAQARTNLRNLIHLLRQALPDAKNYLYTDGPTIQWKPDSNFVLDVAELEKAMMAGAFDYVASIYIGDLLPDCYDEWVIPKREQLRQIYTDALEKLIQQKENEHDYHAAIAYAQCLIRHEPLQEQSYRELMRLYAFSGDRIGVIRTYNTCATILQNELGVEPSEGTRETYNHCLKIDSPAKPSLTSTALPLPARYSNNLPLELTRFIGREQEKSEVKKLLAAHRLVTLTGTGGIGKTRLAIRVAREVLDQYEHGVCLVELAQLTNPDLVPDTVANVLGFQSDRNQPILQVLSHYLSEKTLLLVLDNCEHLIDACAHLTEHLLSNCPNLHILATSREVLGIGGEAALRVPSLSLPPNESLTPKILEQSEAVQLFVERATTVLPSFELTNTNMDPIAKICRRLDGIALAIELAAARVKVIEVGQILARLDNAFHLLTNGSRTALPRQQTLHATLDWSYKLLSEKERIVLRCLSVFAGGCTLEAAESVCADNDKVKSEDLLDLLALLVNKSLVIEYQLSDQARFYLLETTRQYAQEKFLNSGEREFILERHLDYYLKIGEKVKPRLRSAEKLLWQSRLQNERDNIRVALEWSLSKGITRFADKGLQLANIYYLILPANQHSWVESLNWIQKGLALFTSENAYTQLIQAESLSHAGSLANSLDDLDMGSIMLSESVEIYRTNPLADKRDLALALGELAQSIWRQDNGLAKARKMLSESVLILQELGSLAKWELAQVLYLDGWFACADGDCEIARARAQESKVIFEQYGDHVGITWSIGLLGSVSEKLEDYAKAICYYDEAKQILESMIQKFPDATRHPLMGLNLDLARVERLNGCYDSALARFYKNLSYYQELGDKPSIIRTLHELAKIMFAKRNYAQASTFLRESLLLTSEIKSDPYFEKCKGVVIFADIFREQGQFIHAIQLMGALSTIPILNQLIPNIDDSFNLIKNTRNVLGDKIFESTYAEGQMMTLEQAVTYALEVSS